MDEILKERYELAAKRIGELAVEDDGYFSALARRCLYLVKCHDLAVSGKLNGLSLSDLQALNKEGYDELVSDYENSFADPDLAVKVLGSKNGKVLSALYALSFKYILSAYSANTFMITVYLELVLEISGLRSTDSLTSGAIKNAIYYYFHDYCYEFTRIRQTELRDPRANRPLKILTEENLKVPDYLYKSGLYVSGNETDTMSFINSLSDSDVQKMAFAFTDGYERGFYAAGIDYSERKIVEIRYPLGFERIIKSAVEIFVSKGKETVMRFDTGSFSGVCSSSPNRQFEHDHRNDNVLYLDGRYRQVSLDAMEEAYKSLAEQMAVYAGPACLESFGEADFNPVNKASVLKPDDEQNSLTVSIRNESAVILRKYIDMTKRSFTIMSLPSAVIGEGFEDIFREVMAVNTLDNDKYKAIHQKIIDVLDRGKYVRVKGRGDNKTDMKVMLHTLSDPGRETNFENCTADVNIPVGEVFTSPVLTGTCGVLNVSHAYLEGREFKNLCLEFEDGMVRSYSCDNFEKEEENREYIFENILFRRDCLPIGEFAIGTNTTAYAMAEKYGIWKKLPILIAEKTGPHFAVGDTCYSDMEEVRVYNPDGKEIVAKSNEVSDLRDVDRNKAYFNCHTDITIPYHELDYIRVFTENGEELSVIENGLFADPGTEELKAKMLCG